MMENIADLTAVQKTLADRESEPHQVIAERAACSQSAVSKLIHVKLTEEENVVGKGARVTGMMLQQ